MFTDFFFSQGLFKDASPLILTSSARVFWRGCALVFSRGSSFLHFLNEVYSRHFTGQNPEAGITPDRALKEPKWASPSAVGTRSLSGLPSEKSLMGGFMFGDSACIFSKEPRQPWVSVRRRPILPTVPLTPERNESEFPVASAVTQLSYEGRVSPSIFSWEWKCSCLCPITIVTDLRESMLGFISNYNNRSSVSYTE